MLSVQYYPDTFTSSTRCIPRRGVKLESIDTHPTGPAMRGSVRAYKNHPINYSR